MTAKSKATEIANIEQQNSTAVLTSPDPLMAMIERASRDPAIDLDRMERLIKMREREMEIQDARAVSDAEIAFNDALSAVQNELTPIARDSNNPQTHSKYASYFAVDKVIRPVYTKYGFAVSFDTQDCPTPDYIRVVCYLSKGRIVRSYHYDSPADGKGARGNDVMTRTHAGGAALTYAKRYLVGLIFNLSTGEDKDGNRVVTTDTSGAVSDKQIKEVQKLLGNHKGEEAALCKYLKIESLADMTEQSYATAKAAIETKKKKLAAIETAAKAAAKEAAEKSEGEML